MKKILFLLAFVSSLAFGQSYPSPTYNVLTIQTPLALTSGGVGANSAAGARANLGLGTIATQNANAIAITGGSISGISPPIPVASGGTNSAAASGTALDNITGFASNGFLTRTGAGAYAFQSLTNGITLGNIAQIAANTVLANVTNSTANITAFAMPGCSAATNALTWTTSTGFTCNTAINAATLGGATFAAPGAIGSITPNTGAFTTVSATGAWTQAATQNFFQNSSAVVNRQNDRVFIGDATAGSGTAGTAPFDWLSTFQKAVGGLGFGTSEYSQAAVLTNQNTNALIGLTAASQTLNANQVRDFWGIGGYGLNNSASFATNVWGIYGEAHRLTTQAGATYGAEFDTRNITTLSVIDPYTPQTTQTVGVQVASGAGFTGAQADNSAAVNIQNNNAKWNVGINIGATAITGDNGVTGQGIAIATAYGHSWQWYGSSGVGTSRIISFAKTAANSGSLQFDEGFSSIKNSNGVSALQVTNNNTGANFLLVNPANAGASPQLAAAGSDTNIPAYIVGKGTAGVVLGGFTDGSNATSGTDGEYVTNSATGTSLTSGTAANAVSVSLTAGDWDVTGTVTFVPAGTTTMSQYIAGVSTTSAVLPASNTGGVVNNFGTMSAGAGQPAVQAPTVRISLAATTTVYLIADAAFAVSTCTASGFIRARRVR